MMDIVNYKEKIIFGISARTHNENEMNPQTAKIGTLVKRFDANVTVNYQSGARVYNVYSNYESDASGEYSILVGSDSPESSAIELEQSVILEGKYMVFKRSGEVPQIVIDTWMKIWTYFSDDNAEHKRTYTTDFEFYKSQNEIEIYIAIE
ncbi:MAG: GyrI-like domain-containing protein [Agarilytica sp.]